MPEFVAAFNLASIDGTNGFRIDGIDAGDTAGFSVSAAGDVNNDGFDDFILGAPGGDPGGDADAGESYVVFGKAAGFPAGFDPAGLNGTGGFRIDGVDPGDAAGFSLASAGDVNGDGFDDLIVGAPDRDPGGDADAGAAYVVFGKAAGFPAAVDLGALDGTGGFRIDGIDAGDLAGFGVAAAGDIDGDGFGDIVIGAPGAAGGAYSGVGECYVVFGKASGFAASVDAAALDGSDGFRIDGVDAYGFAGRAVSALGDINGDGFDDVAAAAPRALGAGGTEAGELFIVFGKAAGFAATIGGAGLDGVNGFRIEGAGTSDFLGSAVSAAGDVNGDGIGDFVVGAPGFDADGNPDSGAAYVVFGAADGFPALLGMTSLNGLNGFRIDGANTGDANGSSVSGAGDVNGDGFDDLIVGAPKAAAGGDPNAGRSYVVFGRAGGFSASVDVATLDGANGFRIDGIDPSDYGGSSVSGVGDIDGDGFDDILIGADGADAGGDSDAGASYVIYGHRARTSVVRAGSETGQTINGGWGDDLIDGRDGSDRLVGWEGGDTMLGGAGDDTILGGTGDDRLVGGSGLDAADGGFGDDIVEGNEGDDTLSGNEGDDSLSGGSGQDALDGGSGNDAIAAGSGNDNIQASLGDDTVDGGSDTDTLSFATLNSTGIVCNLTTGLIEFTNADGTIAIKNVERVIAASIADTLTGNARNNLLSGGNGKDTLDGVGGNDTLIGGALKDTLTGGAGADVFDFNATSESGTVLNTRDEISDFAAGSDDIDLFTIDAQAGTGGNQAFAFIAQATFSAEGQVRAFQSGANTIVEINTTGTSGAEMTIQLNAFTATAMAAGDFIL